MKRFWRRTTLCAIALCLMVMPSALAGARLSIGELAQSVPDYWDTGIVKNGETVLAPVYVPEVEQMPVVRVKYHQFTRDEIVEALGDIVIEDGKFFRVERGMEPSGYTTYSLALLKDIWQQSWTPILAKDELEPHFWDEGETPTAENSFAEGQILSLAETLSIMQERFDRLLGGFGGNFFAINAWINSPYYEKSGKLSNLGALTGVGNYLMTGVPGVCGVPVFDPILDGFSEHEKARFKGHITSPVINVYAFISGDRYVAEGSALEMTEMLADDVPLCTFDEAVATLQPLIDEGRIIHIYSMKLGYVSYADRDINYPKGNDGWEDVQFRLSPTWICMCSYVKDPNREYPEPDSDSKDANDPFGLDWHRASLMINAQTGELISDHILMTETDYYAPELVTWEDVK